MKLQPLLFLAGSLIVASCTKYDLEPPVIEFINISGMTESIQLNANDIYAIDYRITDNKRIRGVQINARKGYHREENVYTDAKDFTYSNGFDPDNSVKQEPTRFPIPAPVRAGTYRLTMTAKDSNGNSTSEKTLDFIINHPQAPQVDLAINTTYGDLGGPIYDVKRADRIEITGTATDASDITRVKIDMIGQDKSLFSQVFDVPGTDDRSIRIEDVTDNFTFTVPGTAQTGEYKFIVSVTANSGHTTVKAYRIKILF